MNGAFFEKILFPYLEPLTAQKAREKMIHYQNGTLDVTYSEKFIYIIGKVNVIDYLPVFDVCVLSSISESQPLAVLEGEE